MRAMLLAIGILVTFVTPTLAGKYVPCQVDGDCTDGVFCNGVERCEPGAKGFNVCLAPAAPACLAGQTCNEAADVCVTTCGVARDADADGVESIECGGTDCDDHDANRFPGHTETCTAAGGQYDYHDEDCDPSTIGNLDIDGDGEVDFRCCNQKPGGGSLCGADCNDANASVNPFVPEVCDGFDNNCNGVNNEGVSKPLFDDHDGDNHGAGPSAEGCAGDLGKVPLNNDCNDANPAIQPGAMECNPAGGAASVKICSALPTTPGAYSFTNCQSGFVCVSDPNGTGTCVQGGGNMPPGGEVRCPPACTLNLDGSCVC